jgi:hypothetical protein
MFRLCNGWASLACAMLAALGIVVAADASATNGYTYAGVEGWSTTHGVAASLSATRPPLVTAGHVAAWVGFGGFGAGPGGSDEWIQAGLAARSDDALHVYYEVALPGARPRYVQLDAVRPGARIRVVVSELADRPSWWRIWVGSRPVTSPIHLPGSQGWSPTASGESWDGGMRGENEFAFRFDRLRVITTRGGGWRTWADASAFHDVGANVRRIGAAAFLAATPTPAARTTA